MRMEDEVFASSDKGCVEVWVDLSNRKPADSTFVEEGEKQRKRTMRNVTVRKILDVCRGYGTDINIRAGVDFGSAKYADFAFVLMLREGYHIRLFAQSLSSDCLRFCGRMGIEPCIYYGNSFGKMRGLAVEEGVRITAVLPPDCPSTWFGKLTSTGSPIEGVDAVYFAMPERKVELNRELYHSYVVALRTCGYAVNRSVCVACSMSGKCAYGLHGVVGFDQDGFIHSCPFAKGDGSDTVAVDDIHALGDFFGGFDIGRVNGGCADGLVC